MYDYDFIIIKKRNAKHLAISPTDFTLQIQFSLKISCAYFFHEKSAFKYEQ